jgi:CheY-like chemotaxis protein
MIVDDNWVNQLALQNILAKLSYENHQLRILQVGDGQEAVREFRKRNNGAKEKDG